MAVEGLGVSLDSLSNGTSTTTKVLDLTHFNYPWVLLLVFLIAFITNSVLTVEPSETTVGPTVTGPGGKPLPTSARNSKEEKEKQKRKDFSRGRKLLFLYFSAGVIATFIANGVNIIVHALTKSENGWWCGEATAVIQYLLC